MQYLSNMARFVTTFLVVMVAIVSFTIADSLDDMNSLGLKNLMKKYQQSNSTEDLTQIFEMLNKLDLKSILLSNSSNSSLVTQKCYKAYKGLSTSNIFTYLDAIGKPGAGIANGNLYWLGSYKECVDSNNAHYCTFGKIKITAIKQFIVMGLCVPEACTLDDVTNVLKYVQYIAAQLGANLFTVEDNPQMMKTYDADSACYQKTTSLSVGAHVMIFITALIGILCLLGTIVDLVNHYVHEYRGCSYVVHVEDDESTIINNTNNDDKTDDKNYTSMHDVKVEEGSFMVRFLLCFSVIKNSKTLFDTKVPSGAITSVNGIRTLSIMWVILGHVLAFGMGMTDDMVQVIKWLPRFTMEGIENATVSVDTFFLLSGLLVGYLSMKRFKTSGTLPLLRYYLHRYIRLTPSYAYLIFFYAYLYPVLSDGPFWFMQNPDSVQPKNCEKYWWTNLLYINNFYPEGQKSCFNWGWYLANDMQFYVISPIILYAMYRFKWIGVGVANGLFLVACLVTNGVLIYTKNASPLFFNAKSPVFNLTDQTSPTLEYMTHIYTKPYTRISPYIVGLVLGYILINKIAVKGTSKYVFYLGGWIVAVGLGIAVVYGPYSTEDYQWKKPSFVIYGVMFRMVWAMAVGWVIYACHNGYGGLVNDLMSWKAFIPLSRLTYATYLVHPMVIFIFYFSSQVAINMTVLNYAFFFVAVTTISYALAYVVAVCIEYPVFNLEKLLLKF